MQVVFKVFGCGFIILCDLYLCCSFGQLPFAINNIY